MNHLFCKSIILIMIVVGAIGCSGPDPVVMITPFVLKPAEPLPVSENDSPKDLVPGTRECEAAMTHGAFAAENIK